MSAHVYPGLKYDTAKDFASVTVITHSPLLLAANLNFPPKNVAGVESQCLVLGLHTDHGVVLLAVERAVLDGSRVS